MKQFQIGRESVVSEPMVDEFDLSGQVIGGETVEFVQPGEKAEPTIGGRAGRDRALEELTPRRGPVATDGGGQFFSGRDRHAREDQPATLRRRLVDVIDLDVAIAELEGGRAVEDVSRHSVSAWFGVAGHALGPKWLS